MNKKDYIKKLKSQKIFWENSVELSTQQRQNAITSLDAVNVELDKLGGFTNSARKGEITAEDRLKAKARITKKATSQVAL